MQQDYEKINQEMFPFKENGIITEESKNKWLELKGVIKRDQYKSIIIIADKGTDKVSCKNYEKHCKILEQYIKENELQKLGKMGTKPITSNEIKGDDIPF